MIGSPPPARWPRQVLGVATLVAVDVFFAVDVRAVLGSRGPLDPSGWIRLVSSAGVTAVAGWLLVTYVACAVGTRPGRTGRVGRLVAARIAPTVLRRALALTLAAGAWAPAAAQATGVLAGGRAPAAVAMGTAAPAGDALPDPSLRPDAGAPSSASGPGPGPGASRVVVRPGDTLWDLAAQQLGPAATTPRIAVAWPVWFAANRPTLTDPDLILPGQLLTVPATAGLPTPAIGTETP